MRRGQRVFATALLLSLLAHLLAIDNVGIWWTPPASEIAFPIEARLSPAAAAAEAQAPPASPGRSVPAKPKPPAPTVDAAPGEPAPLPGAQTEAPAAAVELHAATPEAPPPVQPPVVPQTPPAPPESPADPRAAAPARALRDLPERLALRYAVQAGEGGFDLGKTVYTWLARDGRYSLVSVTQATGITSLFVSGKIIQTSEGSVTGHGLQPEQFWMAKGERRQAPVRFDWQHKRLILPAGSVELPPLAQDLLSFTFHLAMTVQERDGEWSLPVTNGKKLRDYGFRVLGNETLSLGETRLDSLHLQGTRAGEGSLDVWLAPARHWLPVRIRSLDQKGKVMLLSLEESTPD